MSIALGRAGRDTGLALNSPASWNMSGDDVELRGALTADSYSKLVLLRTQVNGLIDNRDEPAIAVNWPGDVTADGYYEVVDGSVPMPPRGIAALKLDYQLRLRRIAVYPEMNSLISGGVVRPNAHSIVKGGTVPWWGIPADSVMDYVPGGISQATRVAESGSVRIAYTTTGDRLYATTRPWTCLANNYLVGAARIELFDGVNWYALVGRRLPNSSPTTSWRITNGLCRVSYGGGDGLLKVEHYVPGTGLWTVSKIYKLTVTTAPTTIGAFRAIVVRRNSPECVTITLGLDQAAVIRAPVTIDLTLRRGSMFVEGVTSRTPEAVSYGGAELGLFRNTATASTANTAGLHATSADAQAAGKFWIATSLAKTNDLTQGGFYTASDVAVFDWAIGYEPASATGPDTFTNQTFAYFAPTDETVGVCRR